MTFRFWRNRDRELDEEIQGHFRMAIQERIERGMPPAEAAASARRDFGNVSLVLEVTRDMWGWRWLRDVGHDVRYATRGLVRDSWFSTTAIVALACGIGVVTMMVTVLNGYYFRGLPGEGADQIVALGTIDITGERRGVSFLDYQDWRRTVRSFKILEAYAQATVTISDRDQSPESLSSAYVSAGTFGMLDQTPVIGRTFEAAEDRPGAPRVVVLAHRLWVSRYAADPSILGRSVMLNRMPATVVGVMPEGFEFPFRHAMWQPLAQMPGIASSERDHRVITVFGRLVDGVDVGRARAELSALARALAGTYPETNAGIQPTVVRFGEHQVGRLSDAQPPLAAAATAVLVLLVACANVANLLLARSAGRSRELAIRISLGATRWRIVRQLVVESLLIGFAAGGVGLWLSRFGVDFISDAFGRNVPYWMRFDVDGRVWFGLAILCVVSTLLFGTVPAFRASKTDVLSATKEGGRSGVPPQNLRWVSAILVAEVALTVIVLAGAALLVRSFLALYRVDRVVETSGVLTMRLALPEAKHVSPQERAAFYVRLDDQLATLPGLRLATVASTPPFVGAPRQPLTLFERPVGEGGLSVSTVAIGPRYFDSLGLRVHQGRDFLDVDGSPGHLVAIVNQRFADVYYSNESALDRRIRVDEENSEPRDSPWLTIVGVAPTVRQAIAGGASPVVYLPLRAYSRPTATILAGGLSDPASVTPTLRRAVAAADADVTLFNVRPLDELLSDSRLQPWLMGTLLSTFAGIAVLLSMVGLYAVTACAVLQRTHEIGVRMALGAQARQVTWLFLRRGLAPLAFGAGLGLTGALAVGVLLRGILIETSATDPVTLMLVVAVLIAVALVACGLPARRAAKVDPLIALRCE